MQLKLLEKGELPQEGNSITSNLESAQKQSTFQM
jgi:hypothetical protein